MPVETSSATLRARLRRATDPLHSRLDGMFRPGELGDRARYAEFLACQLAAHGPIEQWVRAHCPAELAPPPASELLIEDLQDMGKPFSQRGAGFALPAGADPLGLAWTIAGSHLGNRAILRQIERGCSRLPTRFLSDRATGAFWQRLRPRLERECSAAEAQPAIAAAVHTFLHFGDAFARSGGKVAA